jgi:hypothetical protein
MAQRVVQELRLFSSSFLVGVGTRRPGTSGWLAHSGKHSLTGVKHSASWRIANKKAKSLL